MGRGGSELAEAAHLLMAFLSTRKPWGSLPGLCALILPAPAPTRQAPGARLAEIDCRQIRPSLCPLRAPRQGAPSDQQEANPESCCSTETVVSSKEWFQKKGENNPLILVGSQPLGP